MGFLARLNKIGDDLPSKISKIGDGLARRVKGDSSSPSVVQRQPLTSLADNRQREQAPIVFIQKQPPNEADRDNDDTPPPVPSKPTKRKPAPLIVPSQSTLYTTVTSPNEQPKSSTSLHQRHDSLVSSSLITPRTPSALIARQQRDEIDNDAKMEELKSSPPREDKMESRESLNEIHSSSSKGGASRLFRRGSEKIIDKTHCRQTSRDGNRYDNLLETLGRSLSATSHLSMTSLASTHSFAAYRKQDADTNEGRSSPSMLTAWRRGRAASSASSKDYSPPLSSPASFPRSNMTAQTGNSSIDSPLTSYSIDKLQFVPSEEGTVSAPKWKKLSKKPLRSRHSNSVDTDSIQLYMLRLSPPPRGLAADEIKGRQKLVCNYVHARLSEERKRLSKLAYMRPLTAAPPVPPSTTAEECIEALEDEFQKWMNDDIKQEIDALQYKELHLADVFIEARRSLGVESMSTRLHAMFDINQTQMPDVTALESKRNSRTIEPSISPPPPSAWDNNPRKQVSLTPAPRRRRRPKTTATNHSCSVDDLNHREAISNEDNQSLSNSSNQSLRHKANGSFDSSLEGINSGWTKDDPPRQRKSSPITFPIIQDPASLPPSPPKSIDSHHFAEVIPYTAPPAKTLIISEVLAL